MTDFSFTPDGQLGMKRETRVAIRNRSPPSLRFALQLRTSAAALGDFS
jgi:hypothetical protein